MSIYFYVSLMNLIFENISQFCILFETVMEPYYKLLTSSFILSLMSVEDYGTNVIAFSKFITYFSNFSSFFIILLLILIVTSMFYVVFLKKFISSLTHMITVFVLIAILLFSLNLDFLAILTLLIYIGALLIFFLFAILLLLKFFSFKQLFSTNNVLFYLLELVVVFLVFSLVSTSYFDLIYSSDTLVTYFNNPFIPLVLFFGFYTCLNLLAGVFVPGFLPMFADLEEAQIYSKLEKFRDQLDTLEFCSRPGLKSSTFGLEKMPSNYLDTPLSLDIMSREHQDSSFVDTSFLYSNNYLTSANLTTLSKSCASFNNNGFVFFKELEESDDFFSNSFLYNEKFNFDFPLTGGAVYSLDVYNVLAQKISVIFDEKISLTFLTNLSIHGLAKNLVEVTNIQLYRYTLYTKDGLPMLLISILLLSVVIISALKITTLVYSKNSKTN
jgi:NADH:ubiquinone oxidoreductase subunit 6 (subunit J)